MPDYAQLPLIDNRVLLEIISRVNKNSWAYFVCALSAGVKHNDSAALTAAVCCAGMHAPGGIEKISMRLYVGRCIYDYSFTDAERLLFGQVSESLERQDDTGHMLSMPEVRSLLEPENSIYFSAIWPPNHVVFLDAHQGLADSLVVPKCLTEY